MKNREREQQDTPMATLALAIAGAAVGAALLPAGVSLLGATLTGAAIGSQVGALRRLVHRPRAVRRLRPVARRARPAPLRAARHRLQRRRADPAPLRPRAPRRPDHLGHQLRGGGGPPQQRRRRQGRRSAPRRNPPPSSTATSPTSPSPSPRARSPASAACGPTARSSISPPSPTACYTGSDDQLPDSLIEAKEGAGNAPAYRGLAYIVFERLALADFGNRIPQLSFEVHRAVDPSRQPCAPSP